MVRVDDGQQGYVELVDGEPRIIFSVHGERCLASKQEKWVVEGPLPAPLRLEEKQIVAAAADRQLRALVLNQPFRYWEQPRADEPPFDPGLVATIVDYLTQSR